jgi:hypothetical protein
MLHAFALAPMSALIRWLTVALWLLPAAFGLAGLAASRVLLVPALLLPVLYTGVWLFARPRQFEARAGALDMVFPAWRRSATGVTGARLMTERELRETFGWAMRIGVGGLWGAFGWLWTSRGGLVELYTSRADGLVLVERRGKPPLLVTPDDPEGLVRALA